MTHKPTGGDTSELEWIKSSYSSSNEPGDCVEVAWRKSSYSSSSDPNDCVEIATTPDTVHVRDSKKAPGPQLAFPTSAWADFVTHASQSR